MKLSQKKVYNKANLLKEQNYYLESTFQKKITPYIFLEILGKTAVLKVLEIHGKLQ